MTRMFLMAGLVLAACGDKEAEDPDDDWGLGWDEGGGEGGGEEGSGEGGEGGDDGGDDGVGTEGGGGDTGSPYLGVPDEFSDCEGDEGMTIGVDELMVAGDTLVLWVSYSGGCAEHAFSICWPDQSFTESVPVGAGLEVFHGGEADPCEAWVVERVEFSLSPVQEAYEASYPGSAGEVMLHIGGHSVLYEF